jgi:hypothetical protein
MNKILKLKGYLGDLSPGFLLLLLLHRLLLLLENSESKRKKNTNHMAGKI